MNNDNRFKILQENYSENEGELTFREYVELTAENDPKFFNWFFGSEASNIGDFGIGMTEIQNMEYKEFVGNL